MINRWLVVTGLVAVSASGTWAGTIRGDVWGFWQGAVDPNVLAPLIRQTSDPNAQIRVHAMAEIVRLRATKGWEAIVERLGDRAIVQTEAGEFPVAAVACTALGLLGERQAAPHLIKLLEDQELGEIASRALFLLRNGLHAGRLKTTDLLKDSMGPAGETESSDFRDPYLGSDPANWKAWWTQQGLAGREIRVRVYKDPNRNPADFELVKAKAARSAVPLEAIPGTDPCSIVLICPQDQEDEDLRIMMGRWVVAGCVRDGKSLSVPDRMWRYPRLINTIPDRWRFDDALGEPIRDASVEVWLAGRDKAGRVHRIRFGQWIASENGIETIQVRGGFDPSFVVSHPGYGKVSAFPNVDHTERIRTQLVPLGPGNSHLFSRTRCCPLSSRIASSPGGKT